MCRLEKTASRIKIVILFSNRILCAVFKSLTSPARYLKCNFVKREYNLVTKAAIKNRTVKISFRVLA